MIDLYKERWATLDAHVVTEKKFKRTTSSGAEIEDHYWLIFNAGVVLAHYIAALHNKQLGGGK